MKRFFKNMSFIILITCFILNIVNLIASARYQYSVVIPGLMELAEEVKQKGVTGEEAYELIPSVYYISNGNQIAIQAGSIGLSVFLGITLGMIITFEEKSKIRVIIIYLLGLLLTSLAPTIYEAIYYMNFNNFFDDIGYYLDTIWIWYTLIFFIIYTIKIYANNRKTRELNEILNEKQKQINIEK